MTRQACLSELAEINPPLPAAVRTGDLERLVPFLPMSAVSEQGHATYHERRPIRELLKGYTYFERGDILLAKITPCLENGKAAVLGDLPDTLGFGSTEFHVLRPGPDVDRRYLFHAVWSPPFRRAGAGSFTGSAGQKRLPTSFFERYKIPLPPLAEQRRIAAILDRADAIRRKRRKSLRLLDEFLRSAFLEMFGDPVRNDKGWDVVRLGEIADFLGGGTPSRARPDYFTGTISWASSKDFGSEEMLDTQEHVTPEAIANSATSVVPPGSVLVVVKSKILMHRLPVAITRVPMCFSQDVKSIAVRDRGIQPVYLARHLRVGQQALLHKARGANTEGLTLDHLRRYRVMIPPRPMLDRWEAIESKSTATRLTVAGSLSTSASLFDSLAQRAFRGDL